MLLLIIICFSNCLHYRIGVTKYAVESCYDSKRFVREFWESSKCTKYPFKPSPFSTLKNFTYMTSVFYYSWNTEDCTGPSTMHRYDMGNCYEISETHGNITLKRMRTSSYKNSILLGDRAIAILDGYDDTLGFGRCWDASYYGDFYNDVTCYRQMKVIFNDTMLRFEWYDNAFCNGTMIKSTNLTRGTCSILNSSFAEGTWLPGRYIQVSEAYVYVPYENENSCLSMFRLEHLVLVFLLLVVF